jgi:hypothetical protein
MRWDANKEKLRCLLILHDSFAPLLSVRAGAAFFRAFIVEDRQTGDVSMKARWKYRDPEERNWIQAKTKNRGDVAVSEFVSGLRSVIQEASERMGQPLPPEALKAFYPPDDAGDPASTIIWLEMQDIVEITRVEVGGAS